MGFKLTKQDMRQYQLEEVPDDKLALPTDDFVEGTARMRADRYYVPSAKLAATGSGATQQEIRSYSRGIDGVDEVIASIAEGRFQGGDTTAAALAASDTAEQKAGACTYKSSPGGNRPTTPAFTHVGRWRATRRWVPPEDFDWLTALYAHDQAVQTGDIEALCAERNAQELPGYRDFPELGLDLSLSTISFQGEIIQHGSFLVAPKGMTADGAAEYVTQWEKKTGVVVAPAGWSVESVVESLNP